MLKRAEALFEESYLPRKICWDYRHPFQGAESEEKEDNNCIEKPDNLKILEHMVGYDQELNKETQKLKRLASFVYPDYRQCEKARNKYEEVENKLNVYIKRKYFCHNLEEIQKREVEFVMQRQDMVILLKKYNED